MFRKFAATACLSAAIVASIAGAASASTAPAPVAAAVAHPNAVTYQGRVYIVPAGSTWALKPGTTTWTIKTPSGSTWATVKPAGSTWAVVTPGSIKLG